MTTCSLAAATDKTLRFLMAVYFKTEVLILYLCMFSSKHRWRSLGLWIGYLAQQFWREQLIHQLLLQCTTLGLWEQEVFDSCIPTFGGHSSHHNHIGLFHSPHFCPVLPDTFCLIQQKGDHWLSSALQGSGLIFSANKNQWPCSWVQMGNLQEDVKNLFKWFCIKLDFCTCIGFVRIPRL